MNRFHNSGIRQAVKFESGMIIKKASRFCLACFFWVLGIQLILIIGLISTNVKFIDYLILGYYYLPLIFADSKIAGGGGLGPESINPIAFLYAATIQILLVSYLVCKIRFWLKKRREDQNNGNNGSDQARWIQHPSAPLAEK